MTTIKTVVVCGAGTMGAGIAAAAAQHGYAVVVYDIHQATLDRAKTTLEAIRQKGLASGKVTEAQAQALSEVKYTTVVAECIGDLIIEAVVEKLTVKQELLAAIAGQNHPYTILSSNTSSLSINSIAEALPQPTQVAGLHFFNPAHLMKLVEVVKGNETSLSVVETLDEFVRSLGKTPVHCKDAPGFIVNRVARPYYLQAMKLVQTGACTDMKLIDACMEAAGFKMGPFALMDMIGIDINYSVSRQVWEALGGPERLKPSDLQAQKVEAGKLGRKTGEGFYVYPPKS